MQTCNRLRHFLGFSILCTCTLFSSVFLCAQSSTPPITSPQVPSIRAPTVPTVTAPTTPTLPVLGAPPSFSIGTTTTSSTNSSSTTNTTPTANTALSADLTASALQTLSSFIGDGTDSNALGGLSGLGGLSSLGNLGDLSSLTALMGTDVQSTANSASTDLLLTQILQKLDTLLATVNETTVTQPTVSQQIAPQDTSRILRFTSVDTTANNQNTSVYDILSTCRTVFISEPEKDGTFFLTCDRAYNANGALQNETFYMLFKALATDAFTVAVSVQQQRENKNSILYRLSQSSPLTATRTGNLVTLRTQNHAPQIDLLLDIDFQVN